MLTRCSMEFKFSLRCVYNFSNLTKIVNLAALTEQLVELVNTLSVWEGEEDNVTSTRDQVLRSAGTCFYVISTCLNSVITYFSVIMCFSVIIM